MFFQLEKSETESKIANRLWQFFGAQRHVNCSDQAFKCFATHILLGRQPINFPEFQNRIWQSAF